METSAFVVLALGFFLGLKHAIEADHLAAVSTIVSERKSLWGSALVGGIWGLGHTISLVAAGVFVLVLNFRISEQTERILEFGVGIMLLLLGLNVPENCAGRKDSRPHSRTRRARTCPHSRP
jgi:high-affinity nickel permease